MIKVSKMEINVLIACEESQEVCKAFRAVGITAFSCDIQQPSGGFPQWHIMTDALSLINGNCADCDKIAIENPIGIMSTEYRKPDQIIQPYQFGHNARKSTCLWLKNLPPLMPTNIVYPGQIDKYGFSRGASLDYATDDNGKIIPWNDPRTAKIRSKTYTGIAIAMADQWGGVLKNERGI